MIARICVALAFAGSLTLAGTASADNSVIDPLSAIVGDEVAERVRTGEEPAGGLVVPASAEVSPEAEQPTIAEYSRSFLKTLPEMEGGEQWRCLAEALYFEARGEPALGQFAVAEVIINRAESDDFPDTICKVVNQGTGKKWRCQFTYTCDGLPETINDQAAWEMVGKVARLAMDGEAKELTSGALFYHTKAVNPNWAEVFFRTTTIGAHHFYNPEPVMAQG